MTRACVVALSCDSCSRAARCRCVVILSCDSCIVVCRAACGAGLCGVMPAFLRVCSLLESFVVAVSPSRRLPPSGVGAKGPWWRWNSARISLALQREYGFLSQFLRKMSRSLIRCGDACRYPVGWPTNEVGRPIFVAPETSATASLGKPRRDESHGDRVPVAMNSHDMPHRKRVGGNKENRILKTARSVTRTCLKPVARIPNAKDNNQPKQLGALSGERRGSRPQIRRDFTIDPCWGRVSSRGVRKKLQMDGLSH